MRTKNIFLNGIKLLRGGVGWICKKKKKKKYVMNYLGFVLLLPGFILTDTLT